MVDGKVASTDIDATIEWLVVVLQRVMKSKWSYRV
jgi:hypothetical protein